ncbi:MAG: radical SAM protein, partial [Candidatus Bipolaricaulota bacterium]
QDEVREALNQADWVSLKVDAVSEEVWKGVDRPHKSLDLSRILEGALAFAEGFDGHLSTESMLIQGLNNGKEDSEKVGDFLEQLDPDSAYIAIPTRPPAEEWAKPATEEVINHWFQSFDEKLRDVEYLIGYEGNEFSFSGDVERDLLSITSVHPMKREGVDELLARAGADWGVVNKLLEEEELIKTSYGEEEFFIRKLPNL